MGLEKAKQDEFNTKCKQALQGQVLGNLLSIGHELGLFVTLSQFEKSATSAEIASAATLNERYVREWLNGLAIANVVDLDESVSPPTYFLPREHLSTLLPGVHCVPAMNLMYTFNSLPFPHLVNAFKTGDGIGYEHYAGFHKMMNEVSAATHHGSLIQKFIPSIPGLKAKLEEGISVLDIGCGMGSAIFLMAKEFPNSKFLGLDFAPNAIAKAKEEAKNKYTNAEFEVYDVSKLETAQEYAQKFDYVTAFDAIHDQSHPSSVLRGIHAVLKPEGTFSMVDIHAQTKVTENRDNPFALYLYGASLNHCMAVAMSDKGEGLGNMWGRQKAEEYLTTAGLEVVSIEHMKYNPFNDHYLCKKSRKREREE